MSNDEAFATREWLYDSPRFQHHVHVYHRRRNVELTLSTGEKWVTFIAYIGFEGGDEDLRAARRIETAARQYREHVEAAIQAAK